MRSALPGLHEPSRHMRRLVCPDLEKQLIGSLSGYFVLFAYLHHFDQVLTIPWSDF